MAKKYNCTKNGIQYFRKTKTIGHDADGKPIKKEFYGDGEKDADRQIEEFMNMIKKGVPANFFKVTVAQLMKTWLFDVLYSSINQKSASFEKHETNYRLYIKDSEIGHLTVFDICTQPIQLYYNKLYKNGTYILNEFEEKKFIEVSSDKIFDINKTLRKFFNYCKLTHYITENPCSLMYIEIPGNADGEEDESDDDTIEGNNIQVFNDEELIIMKKNIKYEKR